MKIGKQVGDPAGRVVRVEKEVALSLFFACADIVFDGTCDGGTYCKQRLVTLKYRCRSIRNVKYSECIG